MDSTIGAKEERGERWSGGRQRRSGGGVGVVSWLGDVVWLAHSGAEEAEEDRTVIGRLGWGRPRIKGYVKDRGHVFRSFYIPFLAFWLAVYYLSWGASSV